MPTIGFGALIFGVIKMFAAPLCGLGFVFRFPNPLLFWSKLLLHARGLLASSRAAHINYYPSD
jgi:hypothetical protein